MYPEVNRISVQAALGELFFALRMFDEVVRNTQHDQRYGDAMLGQQFSDGAAGATGYGVIFQRHQQFVAAGEFKNALRVQRFDKAHIHHRCIETFGRLQGVLQGAAECQQGDIFAGLEIWRAANGCVDEKPSSTSSTGQFLRRKWSACADGSALEFALFPGGHGVPAGWADMVIDWFESF